MGNNPVAVAFAFVSEPMARQAYEIGRDARAMGLGSDRCPFYSRADLISRWLEGWQHMDNALTLLQRPPFNAPLPRAFAP